MIASCSGGGLETGNSEEEEDAPAVISDFIYQGASLHNQTDRTGETALHLAARYSRSDAAKRLLEASADANIQDNMGRTPLHAAVSADAQGVFQVGGPSASPCPPCSCSGPRSPGSERGGAGQRVASSRAFAPGAGAGRASDPSVPLPGRPQGPAGQGLLICTHDRRASRRTCPSSLLWPEAWPRAVGRKPPAHPGLWPRWGSQDQGGLEAPMPGALGEVAGRGPPAASPQPLGRAALYRRAGSRAPGRGDHRVFLE